MRARTALFVGALLVALFALPAAGAQGTETTQTYIVQLLQQPAVAYEGGISGLSATKPDKGKKLDPDSSDVKKYADHLRGKHDETLEKSGAARSSTTTSTRSTASRRG